MITSFNEYKKLLENSEASGTTLPDNTALLNVKIDNRDYTFNIKIIDGPPVELKLYLDNKFFRDVSVIIPEFNNSLEDGEFFINPKLEKDILIAMINQNIIDRGHKEAMYGDKKSQSYFI